MADTCGDVRQMYRTIVLLVALTLIMVFSIAGCQTVQGLGRDITLLGETAQDIVD
jgi:predicted small secreted protein